MNLPATNIALDEEVMRFDARAGERIMESLHTFLARFVAYPSDHAGVAHALWIVHSHMMECWDSTPRLAFLSAEPASGKTRALEVTELLVPYPVATVNVSPAYLFRKVGSAEGATILFDEVDTIFGPKAKDNEDIRGLLNAGHRRGATTGRCVVRGKEVTTEELPAYAAVALAGIGWLPDTILSRSIIIRMRRRHAGERVEPFRRRIQAAAGEGVRNMISVWAKAASSRVTWPDLPPQIDDRDADVWESLIAVADAVGGDWPRRAREAGIALVAASKDLEPSLGIRLLQDMKSIMGSLEELSSKEVLRALHDIEEAPWSDLKGKPLDDRSLSSRLRQYGIRSRTIRQGATTPKGYVRTDFLDVWTRYLPPTPAASATSATDPCSNEEERSRANIVEDKPVAVVADVADLDCIGRTCAHCKGVTSPFCEASVGGATIWLHLKCIEYFSG